MDRDWEVRAAACAALAERGIPTTGAVLLPALGDEAPEVRQAAAAALAAVRGPGARRALERACHDELPAVAEAARQALRALDDDDPADEQPPRPTPYEEIADHLERARDPEAKRRAEAVRALGRAADASVTQALVQALEDPSPQVRAAAAEGLVRHPAGRTTERLLELMDDQEPEVRRHAARALGVLRAGAAYASLSVALGDDFQSVRVAAASAMARLGGERVVRELHHAARTWVPGSLPVLDALEELDESVTGAVAVWLEHPYEGVRGVAVEWAADRRASPLRSLVEVVAYDDDEAWLREEARSALARL